MFPAFYWPFHVLLRPLSALVFYLQGVLPTLSPAPSSYIQYQHRREVRSFSVPSCFKALVSHVLTSTSKQCCLVNPIGLYLTNEDFHLPSPNRAHR